MSSATSVTCPECGAVLRPAKPLRAGKSVKCPKCGAGFVVGSEEPPPVATKAKPKPSPITKKPSPKPLPSAPIRIKDDDDDDGDGAAYTVQAPVETEGPIINYSDDKSVRDLRGPAMSVLVGPSNMLILVGVAGFIGWISFLVVLIIPLLFPLQTKAERDKAAEDRLREAKIKLIGKAPGMQEDIKIETDTSFLAIGDIDLRGIGELPWYLVVACLLPLILGMIYSAALSVGAVKVQNLESREWGVASSVMAMIPLNAGGLLCMLALILNICLDFLFEGVFKWIVLVFFLVCLWGTNVAVGIWMLTLLNKPEVIAGYEYVAD